jgi:phosphatidate phosphatase PAH1
VQLVLLLFLVSGCTSSGSSNPDASQDDGAISDGGDSSGDGRFQFCNSAQPPHDLPEESWENPLNEGLSLTGADHSAQDVIAVLGETAAIVGKFAYGPTSKDLEGEWIDVWMDDCSGSYRSLGEARTDSDGRISLSVAPGDLPPTGAYSLYLRVKGDNTSTRSMLRVLPRGTRLMVFDIDGTLTTDDLELVEDIMVDLFEPILSGDYVPQARAGAGDITKLRRNTQGYVLIYLTGRPYMLTGRSRQWLDDLDFPPGNLHLCDDVDDILPSNDSVGDYKAAYLNLLISQGFEIAAGYGNASTDIYAYALAGIDKTRTFILGQNGGGENTVDLGDDYLDHLPIAQADPAAEQPFDW